MKGSIEAATEYGEFVPAINRPSGLARDLYSKRSLLCGIRNAIIYLIKAISYYQSTTPDIRKIKPRSSTSNAIILG